MRLQRENIGTNSNMRDVSDSLKSTLKRMLCPVAKCTRRSYWKVRNYDHKGFLNPIAVDNMKLSFHYCARFIILDIQNSQYLAISHIRSAYTQRNTVIRVISMILVRANASLELACLITILFPAVTPVNIIIMLGTISFQEDSKKRKDNTVSSSGNRESNKNLIQVSN